MASTLATPDTARQPPPAQWPARPRWARPRPARLRPALFRVMPSLLVLSFGLIQLGRSLPLWYDEEYTQLAAGVPLGTLLAGVWNRTGVISYLMDVPPSFNAPYYVVMNLLGHLTGTSALALRLPSLLCGAVAVGVFAEFARRKGGATAGWVCGLLLATGPLYVDEIAQARPYGMALLALSASALWLDAWLETGRGRLRTAVAAGAAGLLHWFALPVIAAFILVSALRGKPGRRMAAALAAACVPAAALVGWSLAGGAAGAPSPPAVGWSLPVTAVVDWSGGIVPLAVALALAAVWGLWRARNLMLTAWIFVPFVLITGLELVRPSYFPRYLLFTLSGLVVAASLGIAALTPLLLRRLAAAALVAASVVGTLPLFSMTVREPGPDAVAYLAAHQQAGEPIIPADGRTSLDLETSLADAPRLAADLALPPEEFTDQTTSDTVWLVRVVLHQNSLAVVPAERRLIDAGWTMTASTLLAGSSTDLKIEEWTR